jgi:hypothetical protein
MSDHCDSVPTVVEETVVAPVDAPAEEVAPTPVVEVEEVAPTPVVEVEEVAPVEAAPAVEVEEVAPSS